MAIKTNVFHSHGFPLESVANRAFFVGFDYFWAKIHSGFAVRIQAVLSKCKNREGKDKDPFHGTPLEP